MRILYVGMKYDYGIPERGLSFEHWNFHDSLTRMGHELIYFDFKSLHQQIGRQAMNRRLWETVKDENPDVLFSILFQEELDRGIVSRVSRETDTVTLNWFCDDHWRFDNYSRHWAPCYNWVVTTAQSALPKYAAMGYRNVIKSQWGFNHSLYRRLNLPLRYDVTFVGQPHGNRRSVVEALRRRGIDVQAWGTGWENGRINQDEMIRVFNQSRISLNLSNASTAGSAPSATPVVARARAAGGRVLERFGLGRRIKGWRRTRVQTKLEGTLYPDQIKARNFEIPGCGGFQLSGLSENLEDYFKIDEEIVCFSDLDELEAKIRYYLSREGERTAIAEAGYARAQREHSYDERFKAIFQRMGLDSS